MPIREFIDAAGVHWRVWNTVPMIGGVAGALVRGWLTFESESERRRLAPIPDGWEDVTPIELRDLCRRAQPTIRTPTGTWRIERDP